MSAEKRDEMRAAVCRTFGEPLTIEDVKLGNVGPTDVHVDIAACAVCHSDIHFAEGAWGGQLPSVYGHEASGTIRAVGDQVEGLTVGDRVVVTLIRSCGQCTQCQRGNFVFCETRFESDSDDRLRGADDEPMRAEMLCGAFAEEAIVDQSQVVAIPDDIDWPIAALLACGVITGVGAVTNTSSADENSTIVVVGAGGVGLNTIQGASIIGAKVIIAVDLAAEKLDTAKAFGATHGIDASADDVVGQIRAATGRKGATHVFVTVGSAAAISSALRYLEPGGELVIVGMPPSGQHIEIDPVILAAVGHRIVGSKMGTADIRRDIPALIDWYREGKLKLDELVTGTYSLDDINEAIRQVGDGSVIRNVVLMG